MSNKEIGIAHLYYKENGEFEEADFKPTITVKMSDKLLREFKKIEGGSNTNLIEFDANATLSTWFSEMNMIELADREKFEITSHVDRCIKWPNGKVRSIKIKFYFNEKVNASADIGVD